MSAAIVTVATLCNIARPSGQDPIPKTTLIASQIRLKALQTFKPNLSFICFETITRSERSSGSSAFHTIDSLSLEVAMVDGKELFSWPGDSKFSNHPPKQLVAAGFTTSGEFLANVQNVLLSNNAVLSYVREGKLHQTKTLQYHFTLSSLVSGYRVFGNDQSAIVPTSGELWVNSDSLELMRLELRADKIPPELGIDHVLTRTDFVASTVGNRRVLLPDVATVTLAEENGRVSKNEISFGHFREYSSKSLVLSNDGSLQKQDLHQDEIEEFLPGGLNINLKLTAPISLQTVRIGDQIGAIVINDVRHKRKVVIPRGTAISGRIRLAERLQEPRAIFILGFEFSDVQFDRKHIIFWAYLSSYAALPTIDSSVRKERYHSLPLFNRGRIDITDVETTVPVELPGVGTLVFTQDNAVLPLGFEMHWISVRPNEAANN